MFELFVSTICRLFCEYCRMYIHVITYINLSTSIFSKIIICFSLIKKALVLIVFSILKLIQRCIDWPQSSNIHSYYLLL